MERRTAERVRVTPLAVLGSTHVMFIMPPPAVLGASRLRASTGGGIHFRSESQ